MDLLTASLPLNYHRHSLSSQEIVDLVMVRVSLIPLVEHVRVRPTGSSLAIAVYVPSTPGSCSRVEAALSAELETLTQLLGNLV